MSERTGRDRGLAVRADGRGLVGHAGAVLLRRCADRVGLTDGLAGVLPQRQGRGRQDRAVVLVRSVVAIVLGATNPSEAERLGLHHGPVFGPGASDSTLRRLPAAPDEAALERVAKVRRRARRQVWSLLHARPGGFPRPTVAGRRLKGWTVIGMDATVITAASRKERAAPTFKGTFGFHPLAARCANTDECPARELRPGNAGAHTVEDHVRVLDAALARVPDSSRAKLLIRVDGAGAPTASWTA